MDDRHRWTELVGGIVMIVVTAFVATFIVSLVNTVCR